MSSSLISAAGVGVKNFSRVEFFTHFKASKVPALKGRETVAATTGFAVATFGAKAPLPSASMHSEFITTGGTAPTASQSCLNRPLQPSSDDWRLRARARDKAS